MPPLASEAAPAKKTLKVKFLVNLPKQKRQRGEIREETPEFLKTLMEGVEYTTDLEETAGKKK